MENKMQPEAVEKELADQLTKAGLTKVQLSDVSKRIASLQKSGIKIIDWHIAGQPPFENQIFEGHLAVEKIASLTSLMAEKNLKDIYILKRGIPPLQVFYNLKATFETNPIVRQ